MSKRKTFDAAAPIQVSAAPKPNNADSLVIELPENPSNHRKIDLTPWLDKGLDEWVRAVAGQFHVLNENKTVSPKTIVSQWSGISKFFMFLMAAGVPFQPDALSRRHIDLYLDWIRNHHEWNKRTQKSYYTHTKSVVVGLQHRGIVSSGKDLFPANPFPGSNSHQGQATALSMGERARLVSALKADIIALHKSEFTGTGSAALTVYLLAIALRTGANSTPLLELKRDCLQPHPFMPNMMLLETFKRRGNATQVKTLRYSRAEGLSVSIPMDGVALIRKVIEFTAPLVPQAQKPHQNRVWLYQGERSSTAGSVGVLSSAMLDYGILLLVARHDLRGDDGQPLNLTLSRLRKTFDNRLWALSDGDLFAVAAVQGRTPQQTDVSYLACSNEMRENATFVGEALPDIYRSGGSDDGAQKIIPIHLEATPVGSCRDSLNGDKAPKNGDYCSDFLSCFSCTSYAIVGSPEDLHRLFSFYWFLERELDRARSNEWRTQFRHTMRLIDTFTLDKFDAQLLAQAKEKARVQPIKFWQSYAIAEQEVEHGAA